MEPTIGRKLKQPISHPFYTSCECRTASAPIALFGGESASAAEEDGQVVTPRAEGGVTPSSLRPGITSLPDSHGS